MIPNIQYIIHKRILKRFAYNLGILNSSRISFSAGVSILFINLIFSIMIILYTGHK